MPRKGWTVMAVGQSPGVHRVHSLVCSVAHSHRSLQHRGSVCRGATQSTSTGAEAATEAACAGVASLEAAISALDSADGPALKSLQEACCPCCPSGRAIGCVRSLHRACQEASGESRRGFSEDPERTRPVGGRVGRRSNSFRTSARRSGIGGPHPSRSAIGCRGRIEEDASSHRRPSARTFSVEGITPHWLAGCREGAIPMDLGTVVDSRSSRMKVDRRSRKQVPSYGGGLEFCLSGTTRWCSAGGGLSERVHFWDLLM